MLNIIFMKRLILFHVICKLGHWTGHKSRLDRPLTGKFGSPGYAREELRAEIASAMLCMQLGIEPKIADNHKAYIKSWVEVLKKEPKEILKAASDAEKISDFIMSFDPEYIKAKEACQAQKLLTDSEPITQQCVLRNIGSHNTHSGII